MWEIVFVMVLVAFGLGYVWGRYTARADMEVRRRKADLSIFVGPGFRRHD